MSGNKQVFLPAVYFKYVKPLPVPSRAEQMKIKRSLCQDADWKFPRCTGKCKNRIKKLEEGGDFSHSGSRREHTCELCRCKRVAGWGTKHYGVGNCFYHDIDHSRRLAKAMTTALQQGYPLAPVKYQSESQYIEAIRRMAEESQGRLNMAEELILLRSHLQEVEKLWNDKDNPLTMASRSGSTKMTDDVKIGCLVKLTEAISKLSRDQFSITESDYVHLDEVKTWLWSIWQCITRNIQKMIVGELNPNNLQEAIQNEFKQIPIPKSGRKGSK